MTLIEEAAKAMQAVSVGGQKIGFSDEYALEMARAAFDVFRRQSPPDTNNQSWDNEPTIQRGRPYDGAIVKDGRLIIPNR